MKRPKPPNAESQRAAGVRENFSPDQLEAIGAVTLAWNEAELILDIALGESLDLNAAMWFEVSTRINGIHGKVEIIRKTREIWSHVLKDDTFDLIEATFSSFLEYKSYRDAVIHARAFDAPRGIGELTRRRAKKEQVLLTVDALIGLYDRLKIIRGELIYIVMIFTTARFEPTHTAEYRQMTELKVQEYVAQLQQHQTDRQSLPPLPKFPQSPPTPEGREGDPPNQEN